jgi:riboflavin synthase
MFTGLIEATGRLVDRATTGGGLRLRIESPLAARVEVGDSLAVNGVCLTVALAEAGSFHTDVGPETARVTTLGVLAPGATVNLERPLRADGRVGGHFLQGHVDDVGWIEGRRREAEFEWLTVGFPSHLAPYLVPKGSIALDGISLTIARLEGDRFDVQIVPYTLANTNVQDLRLRDRVNLECDILGKYVARVVELSALARQGGCGR